MNRKVLIVTLVSALMMLGAVRGFSQANRAAVEKQIVAAERAINEAFAKNDAKGFHANLAPDAIAVDSSGVMKVDAEFDKMLQAVKTQSWNLDMSQFYWVNDTTVVHIYR